MSINVSVGISKEERCTPYDVTCIVVSYVMSKLVIVICHTIGTKPAGICMTTGLIETLISHESAARKLASIESPNAESFDCSASFK